MRLPGQHNFSVPTKKFSRTPARTKKVLAYPQKIFSVHALSRLSYGEGGGLLPYYPVLRFYVMWFNYRVNWLPNKWSFVNFGFPSSKMSISITSYIIITNITLIVITR